MKITEFTSELNVILDNYEKFAEKNQSNNNPITGLVEVFLKENSQEKIPRNPILGNRIRSVLPHFQSNRRIYEVLKDLMRSLCAESLLPLPEELMVHVLTFANAPGNTVASVTSNSVSQGWNRVNFDARINSINSNRITFKELAKKPLSEEVLEGLTDFICRAGKKIRYLDLSEIPITDQQLAKIQAACPNITDLTLDSIYISSKGLESLVAMKKLEALAVVAGNGYYALPLSWSELTNLKSLKIKNFGAVDLDKFFNLKNLSIELGCVLLEEEALRVNLEHLSNLESLCLSTGLVITDSGEFDCLPISLHNPKLKKITLSCFVINALPKSVEELELYDCAVSNEDLLRVLSHLKVKLDGDLSIIPPEIT